MSGKRDELLRALREVPMFLDALGIEADDRLCLFRRMGDERRPVRTFHTAERVAGWCADDGSEVYLCPNVFTSGATRRTVAEIARVTALPGDLDYKDNGCASQGGAEKVMDAISVAISCEPGVVVHSGGGLQPYWLLAGGDDVERAARLQWWFGLLQRNVAEDLGYHLDSTFTAERVWRVPGTLNHKYDPPVRVEVEYVGDLGERPTLDELERALDSYWVTRPPERAGPNTVVSKAVGHHGRVPGGGHPAVRQLRRARVGERNTKLFNSACWLLREGYSTSRLREVALALGLCEDEVRDTLASADRAVRSGG